MKKFLFVLIFLVLHTCVHAQQFSQYFTGTLYDGLENPAQKTFIPDSSRKVAFNLFIPNFSADVMLTGNAQAAVKRRAFFYDYDGYNLPLTIGQNKFNRINTDVSAYAFMLKTYTSLNGDQEFGIFFKTTAEGRGIFTDESIQILANNHLFNNDTYTDILNDKFNYQVYHELGVSYRGNITDDFALGIKLSGLMGVLYNKVNIYNSAINFDRANDRAFLSMTGSYYASFEPGKFSKNDLLPSTQNPGAAISFGATYTTPQQVHLQFNLKNLGFIHWSSLSSRGDFSNTGVINGLSERGAEDSIYTTTVALFQSSPYKGSFTTPTNAHIEFAASKTYPITEQIKYTPALILSKELFYTGFTAAMVNHLNYHNFTGTLTGTYDDYHIFNLGGQLMIKSPNAEFFIGCDRLLESYSLAWAGLKKNPTQTAKIGQYSGANFFMGFSLKIGALIEHPANASDIPMGDRRNFIQRFWQRITGKENY